MPADRGNIRFGAAGNTSGKTSITADELHEVIRSERLPGAADIRRPALDPDGQLHRVTLG
jgi:hypothetical protein